MTTGTMDNEMHLESKLAAVLNQIQPDPGFVKKAYEKITDPTYLRVEKVRSSVGIITVGLGLFVGALIIWLVKSLGKKKPA